MPQIPVEQEPVQSLDVHATYVLRDLLEWIHESARPAVAMPLSVNIVAQPDLSRRSPTTFQKLISMCSLPNIG